jgi:hypothetical protein
VPGSPDLAFPIADDRKDELSAVLHFQGGADLLSFLASPTSLLEDLIFEGNLPRTEVD